MGEDRFCVVLVTTSDEEEARRIAEQLLDRKLVACVNVVPKVESRFWWQGKLDVASESLLVIKTKRTVLPELERVVRAAHGYSVPEIIALPIVWGSGPYLDWIADEVPDPEARP